jgi:hypothetical protein
MSLVSRYFTAVLAIWGAGTSIAVAPIVIADPALPEPGSEDAAATISDLQSRGYDVQINYDNGVPNVDLSQCWVNSIDTADATGNLPTVYVDIACPN